jgi:nitrite reductase (NO-forming)
VSAIAICLVIGFGGRTLYALGALFSLLVWSTAEGFGGPYAVGVSNIGTAITYVLIFLALIGLHYRAGLVPYSLDYLIERRWPRWQKIAEWSSATEPPPAPEALPPGVQIVAVLGIVVVLALLIAGLPSTLNVKSASPSTAAAAVSPLMLASKEPIQKARDARLPPVAGDGRTATIEVIAEDQKVAIANGVEYQAWTFGGQVPAP